MNHDINKLLEELYAFDNSFRNHEKELIQIIEIMMKNKPNTDIDEIFKDNLLQGIKQKISQLEYNKPKTNFILSLTNLFMNKNLNIAMSGLALVVIAVSFYQFFPTENISKITSTDGNISISENDKEGAFGDFTFNNGFESMRSQSGGGGMGGGGGEAYSDAKMIAPYPYPYNRNIIFKSEGEFPTFEPKMNVYKKDKNIAKNLATNILENLDIKNIDKEVLKSSYVQSLNLVQDEDKGYNFYLDFENGTFSVSKNYLRWPAPVESECNNKGPDCYEKLRLKITDVPKDEVIIKLANQYVNQYKIDLSNYGAPEVNNQWRLGYERSEYKSTYYIPETISVLFPLMVNGYEVYDEWGNKFGMNVNINIRDNSLDGMWQIESLAYEASSYPTEDDISKIKEFIEVGGTNGYKISGPGIKTYTIKLSAPKISLMKIYKYVGNTTEEYLVPAMVFDLKEIPKEAEEYSYRTSIVVPILKNALDFKGEPTPPIRTLDNSTAVPAPEVMEKKE